MRILTFSVKNDSGISFESLHKHCKQVWNCSISKEESETGRFTAWLQKVDLLAEEQGISTWELDVALVTGCETSNGHALVHQGRGVAWISMSNYLSDDQIRVFVTHEIVHALHYAAVSDYAFSTPDGKNHVGRQFVTEGLATYATMQLLGCEVSFALWADYLHEDELRALMRRYETNLQFSASKILHDWEAVDTQYFYANDSNDVDTYRSGYFVGLKVIEQIAERQNLKLAELMRMPRPELDALAKVELKNMAAES